MTRSSSGQLELFSKRSRGLRVTCKKSPPPRQISRTTKNSKVAHETRPEVSGPLHVVLRIKRGLPELRTPRALRRLEGAFRGGKEKNGFGLLHYNVERDHLHLVVEVRNKRKLSKGMQGLSIRIAKALNSMWKRRKGAVFADRYFAVALSTARQIWRTVRYVLNNGRKHGTWRVKDQPDPYSSGRWFTGWLGAHFCRPTRSSPVVAARGFELYWRIDVNEVPGPRWHELSVFDPNG
jgi:REP element-mobilizing transposase RayT